jgi:hypothetical protein
MYALWNENGKCPPTVMAEAVWMPVFVLKEVGFVPDGKLRMQFLSRPGTTYRVEYTDDLGGGEEAWHPFAQDGIFVATETVSTFEDDFTVNTSGGPSSTGRRFYRFAYSADED